MNKMSMSCILIKYIIHVGMICFCRPKKKNKKRLIMSKYRLLDVLVCPSTLLQILNYVVGTTGAV